MISHIKFYWLHHCKQAGLPLLKWPLQMTTLQSMCMLRIARTTVPIFPSISLNDNKMSTFEFNGYYALKITPEGHLLTAKKNSGNLAKIKITLQSGDVKYINYVEQATGNVKHINGTTQPSVRSSLIEQSSELANREIINTKLFSQL